MKITGLPNTMPQDLSGLRTFTLKVFDGLMNRLKAGEQKLRIPTYWSDEKPSKGMIVHDPPELFYQVSGTTIFDFPGETIHVNEGDICYVPGNVFHKERALKQGGRFCQLVVVGYNGRLTYHLGGALASGRPEIVFRSNLIAYDSQVGAEYFESLMRLFHHADRSDLETIQGALMTYVAYLRLRIESAPARHAPLSGIVQRCRHLIHNHFHDPSLNVQRLAEWCDCTPNYLSAIFVSDTGAKITETISGMRIDRARQLLRNTDYQISEVAWISGFASANYFSRCFRKLTGQSPKAYRSLNH